ncbi:hypothetical protein WBJ53_04445 [Spirosoma sp. SC4-14]|uniref:hypothetical protein n=1 Tax=Spirosoma sp. SC4-14 TaxID=3128900 RepID=UPI0030CAF40D
MATILPLLIAFGGLFFGALFFFVGWYLWYDGRDLRTSGLTVTATILKKFRKADQGAWGNLESYYAQCLFHDAAGQPREVDVYMHSRLWAQVTEGTTTQLTYVPDELDEPLPGSRSNWEVRGIVGVGLMAFAVLLILTLTIGGIQAWLSANHAF